MRGAIIKTFGEPSDVLELANVEDALRGLPAWNGRVLIDATNPFSEYSPQLVLAGLGDRGASEVVAALAPGARIVKAFNSIVTDRFNEGPAKNGGRRVICFDDGKASEFNTLLVTDWLAHTPPADLAINFGMPADTFSKIPLNDLYIFQGEMPGPLEAEQQQAAGDAGPPTLRSAFQLNEVAPTRQTKGGMVQIADSSNFKASKTIAAALVTIHPGGMREMHWHPNADEWQYFISGQGQATVFNTGPKAVTQNFNPGDVGYIKRAYGHYIRNTGNTDLVYLEVFRSSYFADVSLSDWLSHTPRAMVAQHLSIDPATVANFPSGKPLVVPV